MGCYASKPQASQQHERGGAAPDLPCALRYLTVPSRFSLQEVVPYARRPHAKGCRCEQQETPATSGTQGGGVGCGVSRATPGQVRQGAGGVGLAWLGFQPGLVFQSLASSTQT